MGEESIDLQAPSPTRKQVLHVCSFLVHVCASVKFTKQGPTGVPYPISGEMGWRGAENTVWLRQSAIKLYLCAAGCQGRGESKRVEDSCEAGQWSSTQCAPHAAEVCLDPLLSPFHHSRLGHDRLQQPNTEE